MKVNESLLAIRTLVVSLLIVCGAIPAMAGHDTHYARVSVTATPTGQGKVYMTTDGDYVPEDGDWQNNMSATWNCDDGVDDETDSRTYYVHAQPASGYHFEKWSSNSSGTDSKSTAAKYAYSTSASSTSSGSPTTNNIYAIFEANPVYTGTFLLSENGTFKYQYGESAEVTVTSQHSVTTNQNFTFTALPAAGYTLYGWYTKSSGTKTYFDYTSTTISSYALPGNISIGVDFVPVGTPIFQIKGANRTYTDLNAAITACGSATKTIVLINNGTLPAGNYTIPANVTLLIPFDAGFTCYTTTPSLTTNSYITAEVYRTLTMAPGATLTVNGAISVSAKLSSKGGYGPNGAPSGKYGAIKMLTEGNTKSKITLKSGAKLYGWGYVYGEGAVEALSGSTVYEGFVIMDWRGGNNTLDMYDNRSTYKVFPFNQYYIQNIEVPLTIHKGATETVYSSVYGNGSDNPLAITMVGESNGLFRITGTGAKLTKWYDPFYDRQHYELEGAAAINAISFTAFSMTVSSSAFVLPITNNMDITVRNGATVSIAEDICIMPDASVTVEQGATVNIAKNVYVYDIQACTNAKTYTTSRGGYPSAGPGRYAAGAYVRRISYSPSWAALSDREIRRVQNMSSAHFQVNGTLNVSGKLYTTEGGADIFSATDGAAVNLVSGAGTATKTYQVDHEDYDAYYYTIPITSAQLHNADGSYQATAGNAANTTWTYAHGHWGWRIIWRLEDGTELKRMYQPAQPNGTWLSSNAPATTKPNEGTCSFVFNGWNTVTNTSQQEIVLTADYTKNCAEYYDVLWKSEDGTVTYETDEHVGKGETTRYNGAAPVKADDKINGFTYTFDGWTTLPNGGGTKYNIGGTPAATGNVTYYAHFAAAEVAATVTANGVVSYYPSIADAFAAANTSDYTPTIQVWRDAQNTPALTYTAKNHCTLDLNGHTVSGTNMPLLTINDEGFTFTVTDRTETKEGKLAGTSGVSQAFVVSLVSGIFRLEAGTVYGQNTGTGVMAGVYAGANREVIMTGGTIQVDANSGTGYGIFAQGKGTINGGTIRVESSAKAAYAVQAQGANGNVTITDGKFYAAGKTTVTCVLAKGGASLTVNGGYYNTNTYLATYLGAGRHIFNLPSSELPYKYKVGTGGYAVIFQNTDGTVLQSGWWEGGATPEYTGDAPAKPGDTGGEFIHSGWTPELAPVTGDAIYTATYVPAPPVASVTISGSTTDYIHFDDAWTAVNTATAASTLTLLQDVTVTAKLTYNNSNNKNCTLDLNGHTLTSNTNQQSPLHINNENVTFTITDGTENKSGKLSLTTSYSAAIFGVYVKYGAFRLEGGTIEVRSSSAATHGVTVHYGTFTMNGGTIHVKTTNGKDGRGIYVNSTTIINGGTVHVEAAGTACGVRRDGGTITINNGKFNISGSTASYMNYKEEADANLVIKGGYYSINTRLGTYVSNPYHIFDLTSGAEFDEGYLYKVAEGYTVTFKNDNETLQSGLWEKGATPLYSSATPTKAATAQYTYTFDGWSPAITAVTTDATYTAQFSSTVNTYSVTWKDADGTTLETDENVPYGNTPAYNGATPQKATDAEYTYTFKGWDAEVSAVTGDVTYTATYTTTPVVVSVTVNATGYTLYYTDFSKAFTVAREATAAVTITLLKDASSAALQYSSNNTDCTLDLNGHTLTSTATQLMVNINKAGSTFTITDKSESKSGQMRIEATNTSEAYGVYVSHGHLKLEAGTIYASLVATTCAGVRAVNANSSFTMDGGTIHVVTTNAKNGIGVTASNGTTVIHGGTIQVEAAADGYGIRRDGGTVTVNDGKFNISATGSAYATNQTSTNTSVVIRGGYYTTNSRLNPTAPYHVFGLDNQSPYLYEVAEGYTLTWTTDGNPLMGTYTSGVTKPGATIVEPATPTKTGYTFAGWSSAVAAAMPAEDTEYMAIWTPNTNTAYAVKHYQQNIADDEYTLFETENLTGTTDAATEAVAKSYTGFTAQSFSQSTIAPDGSTTVSIYYNRDKFTITWNNADGTTLETDANVKYGALPVYDGATPTKATDAEYAYAFNTWSPAVSAVTGDVTYTATYTTTPVVASVTTSSATTYYTTFATAWTAANSATAASTLTLLQDISGLSSSRTYSASHDLTLDLNGHTLSGSGTSLFQVGCAGYTFTVTDGSANHDGKLSFTTAESSTSSFHCVIVNSGTFVLEAGTIEATSSTVSIGAVQVAGGTFTMNENGAVHAIYTGNVAGKNSRLVHANGGTTTINGGSIRLESKKDAIGVVYSSGNVTFNGGLFNISASGTAAVTNQTGVKNSLNIRGGYYSANTTGYFEPHVKTPYHIFSNSDETYIYRVAEVYTVTFKNDDVTLQSDLWEKGATPAYTGTTPTKAATAQYTYTFDDWSPAITPVTADVTYTAQFSSTVNTYTVTWKNADGTTLETDENVPYGNTPEYNGATPTKAIDAEYAYTFDTWTPEVSAVTGDATYTATYTTTPVVASVTINDAITYYTNIDATFTAANASATHEPTITLLQDAVTTTTSMLSYTGAKNCTLNLNGHTLSSTTAQALLYINKAGITFTITDLTESKSGSLHLESTSTVNRWCVYVANGNLQMDAGTVFLRSKANQFNEGIRIDPAASTFTMNGGKVHVVTSNGKSACGIVSRGKAFINGGEIQVETSGAGYGIEARVSDDGNNIGNVTVNGGKFLVTGATAACAYRSDNKATLKLQGGYYNTNAGLSTYCAANYHVLPLTGEDPYKYEVAEAYTVTFNANGHGTAPVGQTVKNGEKATAPTAPTAIGYTFGGWYKEEACTNQWNFASDAVTTATTLYAKWTPNNVTITWVDGNGVSHEADATYGTIPTAPDEAKVKDPTEDYTYEFSGWDKDVVAATASTTYTAQFNAVERIYGDAYRLDIADWSGNTASGTVTLNMNGYSLPRAKTNWKVVFGGSEYTKANWDAATRLLSITGADLLTAGSNLTIKVYDYKEGSTSEYECVSRQHYQVPIVVNSSAALSTLSPAATSDVRVRDGATLTVSSNAMLRTVLVDAGSALKIESGATLTVTDRLVLRTRTQQNIDYRAPELINKGTLTLNDGAKFYYSRVVSDNSELYPIGFPFEVTLSQVILSNSNMVTAIRGTHFALQSYDAERRAEYGMGGNWMLYEGNKMEASKGYLLLSTSKYYREFLFPVSYLKPSANATVAVEAHESRTGNPSDEGWNMIVTPFTATASTKSGEPSETIKIAKLYEDNVNYYQDVATNLEPATPFYYQHAGTADGELSFKETPNRILRRSPRLNYTDRSVEEEWVRLSYGKTSQDSRRDVANIFAHSDRFTEEYESGADVVKMSTTGDRALLYSSLACGDLAFAAVPDSLIEQGLPLTVNSPSEGEYRFELEPTDNLSRLESLYLYDDTYGSMIDLLESDYTTDVAAGVSRGRFRLFGVYRAPQIATDIDVVNGGNGVNGDADANGGNGGNGGNGAKPRKIMRDGYIYILMPNGDVYSVIGKRVEML